MCRYPFICLGIILCLVFAISAEGLPGRRLQASSSKIPIQTQEKEESITFVLSMKITNRIYNKSLEDHNSDYYVKLSEEVINLLQQIYGCSECATFNTYEGVTDISFSNGTVIANSTLEFSPTTITGDIVKYTFYNAFISGPELHTSLIVDPIYTSDLPAPVRVPIPVMTTTPPPTTTTATATTTQPTTTSLSVSTTHQSVVTTNQYHSDISSSTHDSDLSKVTSPSHTITDSAYTSTPDHITNTATSLSIHVTNTLNSSFTTSPNNNSELTHSTTPSSHVTNEPNNSDTTLSENTTDSTHITTSPPSSKDTNGTFSSASTLSKNATDSTDTATSPLSSHTTNGISSLATTLSENTTDFSKNTKSAPLFITNHTTRGSLKTDSNSSPKSTTSITKPIHWSTTSKSGMSTAMSWHSARHVNTHPKASTNSTSSHNHSHINILSTSKPKNRSATGSSSYDGIPGWGIALLVLASVILLLLIIFLIHALWRWCCHREETGLINVTGSPKPYDREPSAPEFLTMDPYQKIYPEEFDKPKKNRTGMYVVNP